MPVVVTDRWALAWAALCGAFGIHVLDEATHDFLAWYNPIATTVRTELPWLPVPVFSFPVWLGGLVAVVLVLTALTVVVHRRRRWLVPVAYVYGVVHVLNGTGHIALSILGWWWAPGVYSAPLLLAAAVWLLYETNRVHRLAHSDAVT